MIPSSPIKGSTFGNTIARPSFLLMHSPAQNRPHGLYDVFGVFPEIGQRPSASDSRQIIADGGLEAAAFDALLDVPDGALEPLRFRPPHVRGVSESHDLPLGCSVGCQNALERGCGLLASPENQRIGLYG